jgi:hypothetical protein
MQTIAATFDASKTDVDPMLGFDFHNLWCLWRCHHSVNSWSHHIRMREKAWLHPYVKAEYAKDREGRRFAT